MREWLKDLIDNLGLASLSSFPTAELSSGLPRVITALAAYLEDPSGIEIGDQGLDELADCIASLRQEDASLARTIADYTNLKKLLLSAAADGLRASDQAVIHIINTLDDGFYQVFILGLEAFVEQHSLELQRLANTDPLTGLHNVRYFRRQLHQQLELYKRYRIPFSLIMFDLDELKQLNDIRGHDAGDLALKKLAVILKKEKRETDIAVRYGGDEFFLLLPGTVADEGERLAYRISRRVKELNLQTRGEEITGVSIGVVSCPDNGTDVGALRAKADRAMYLAKTLGGGTVARFREFQAS
ncbi:MAG: GGDEF domain-containing protein [Chloroflexi bacterium]|nr:GGDEF domain-containing protein [Chloroflexota bacterium]